MIARHRRNNLAVSKTSEINNSLTSVTEKVFIECFGLKNPLAEEIRRGPLYTGFYDAFNIHGPRAKALYRSKRSQLFYNHGYIWGSFYHMKYKLGK